MTMSRHIVNTCSGIFQLIDSISLSLSLSLYIIDREKTNKKTGTNRKGKRTKKKEFSPYSTQEI